MANPPKGKAKATPAVAKKLATPVSKTLANRGKPKPAIADQKYLVSGTVLYADSTPATSLTIIAYDKDVSSQDSLGQSVATNESGTFAIPYSEADFRRTDKERGGADVVVCVYDDRNGKHELLFTSKKKNNAPLKYELNITLPVEPFMVRGTVKDANFKPLAKMLVQVYERDIRILQLLGTAETDADGGYRIGYRPKDFQLAAVPSHRAPWLIVEVRASTDGDVFVKQEVQKAARDQTVSFTLLSVGAVSEWQRIGEAVAPLLKGQGGERVETASRSSVGNKADLAPYDITPADVGFIVTETGLDRPAVEAWVASSRMARDTVSRLTNEYAAEQSLVGEHGWSFFYGLARQGLASDLDAALRASQQEWEKAWKAAQSAHRVPALNEKQVTSLMSMLRLLQRLQQIDPQRDDKNDLAKVLTGLSQPLPKAIALDALAIFQEKGLNDIDALLELTVRHPDAEASIKTFVRGVRVHQLTSGHEGFSRVVNARLEGSSDSIAPLAALPSTEWITMATEASISLGLALQTQAQVEKQHPLTALESKIQAGLYDLPGLSGGEAAALIKNQPTLVKNLLLGKVPVKADEPTTVSVLRNTGRFLRTGVSMELAADLINSGIDSPVVALRYGREHLREQSRDALPKEAVSEVMDSFFEYTNGLVEGGKGVTIEMDINRRGPGRSWLGDQEEYRAQLPESVRENAPTLAALFGDLDECICRPCESMLGQPAYLVDLLNLLAKITTEKSGNALDELRRRRLDIFELKLSCEFAEKIVQHIDIVLGILEKEAASEAAPEDAYPKLRQSLYPWLLPFDRGYAEVSAYLAKLGVSREKLLRLRLGTIPSHLAAEALHIPMDQTVDQNVDSQWGLLTQQRLGTQLWAAYGFDIDNDIRTIDPASRELLTNQTVEEVLTRASFLIDRTGLTLDELEQALKTEFVSGYSGGIQLNNREQCKTSLMRLPAEGPVLEGILDRLHRFTRLWAKLPGWSIEQLSGAISVCGGIEAEAIADETLAIQARANVLVKLTIIMRLHDDHGFALDALLEVPLSETRLRQALGLSLLQFALLKEITGYIPSAQSRDWLALEGFCNAAKRLREIGLSLEQAAQALLTRTRWTEVAGELPPSIKTSEQIETLLGLVQQRLRSVVAVRPDVTLESQVTEALTVIYDAATAGKLVQAIRDASATPPIAPTSAMLNELVEKLSGTTNGPHILGEWMPLFTDAEARELLNVITTTQPSNPKADNRFEDLLNAIAPRRRERELIKVVSEQCELSETEATAFLGSRLLLDSPTQGQPPEFASVVFIGEDFWADIPPATITIPPTPPTVPGVTFADIPRLHAWMDRLYRLKALSTALAIDNELMQIADKVVVGSVPGINWSEMLSAAPVAGSNAWQNPQWQALLDLLWLQQPEQLSRPALGELLKRLVVPGALVSSNTLRPLTARVDISETPETLAMKLMAQALSVQSNPITALGLRNPGKLRLAFEWLLLAKQLGADATQIAQLIDPAKNALAANTAKSLLEAKLTGEDLKASLRKIDNSLRQQRRDALVAYHTSDIIGSDRKKWSDAKALYDHFLIDPQMEPCFDTTPILEAVTAVQLFVQRILFGIEPGITAHPIIKQRWTWMRNYRVWEANRKVFLFPENWLFPELRDDKSSSFKQLESALGQGELTQDLANQAFGQFLDDVAQMGQIEVLGMYEDLSRGTAGEIIGYLQPNNMLLPERRTLYVVSRSLNPPYNYFWRSCENFGSEAMEWAPWQRIELDIQGDHVFPFVLGGQLYVAWPLIRRIEGETPDADTWEVKIAWSRHDGKGWKKSSISREFWSDKAGAFADERRSFAFRAETVLNERSAEKSAKISVYVLRNKPGETNEIDETPPTTYTPLDDTPPEWDIEAHPKTAADINNAYHFLDTLIQNNYPNLPPETSKQLEIYAYWRKYFDGTERPAWQGVLLALMERGSDTNTKIILFSNPVVAAKRFDDAPLPNADTKPIDQTWREASVRHFLWAYWADANRTLPGASSINDAGFNAFHTGLQAISSRRVVICRAWIKLRAPDSTRNFSLKKLSGAASEGIYSCLIGGESIPFVPDQRNPLSWKLGAQGSVTCSLTLSVIWKKPAIGSTPANSLSIRLTKEIVLPDIGASKETTQYLYFELDGTKYNDGTTTTAIDAKDIGFDLDNEKELLPVTEFHLTCDDVVSKSLPRVSIPLFSPVDKTQPWMNGYREMSTEQDRQPVTPFRIAYSDFPSTSELIFDPTSAAEFWAVGSATSRKESVAAVPISMAWHYSENDRGCYIDLGYRVRLVHSGLRVYPNSYPEATLRRSNWYKNQTQPSVRDEQFLAAQSSPFGSSNFPVPRIASAVDWLAVQNGDLAFDARLPYACYNWEVFFHAPLLIADQLSKQHKFEDAERWLRYVFDPTSSDTGPDAKRFLKFQVFRDLELNQQVIDDLTLLAQVAGGFGDPDSEEDKKKLEDVKKLIDRWRDAPFRPFLIARRRHIAFLWRTLFAYLDNLIAWADSLYRRDTRESINEATMLYVLAERILGRRPQLHKGKVNREAYTYDQKIERWDDFANFWIDVGAHGTSNLKTATRPADNINQPNPDGMLYFCMPFNDKISSYWDTVDPRLSNIRNCRNIEGITRSLPFTDAPIDPELLIRATAAGLDLGDVIAGLYAPPPHYRYSILSARAAELTNEAKALGAAMLSAIEKRDAEHLAKLRSSNEISLLKLVSEVRKLQITEADRNIDALRASRKSIGTRYNQYQRLLGIKDIKVPEEGKSAGEQSMLGNVESGLASKHSNWGLIKEEDEQYVGFEEASGWSTASGIAKTASGVTHALGAIFAPNPATDGGYKAFSAIAHGLSAVGDGFSIVSQGWKSYAEQQGMMAGHIRRRDEWAFQSNQTLKELQQIDKQILANQIRIDITNKELNNHIEQIEQSKAVDEVMRSKFSNEQLYEWMKTELSKLYFNAYRMALEMARKAERAAARELGVKPLNILGNAYWDSLREGLLAGERLHQDLKRLEITYLDQNRREFELTKHVSLRRLKPDELVKLRVTRTEGTHKHNSCEFEVPEWLFDLDTPGHYLRRIKSVSVSIPSVTGPFTSVSCKLTLLKSAVRHERTSTPATYKRPLTGDDQRFTDYYGATEAIVTSTGNADSGLFETQLRDERFLPFEGSGVIGTWRLELPAEYPQFDYSTISDVVLTIRYTARDGGEDLQNHASAAITTDLTNSTVSDRLRFKVLLSGRYDFPSEWASSLSGRTDLTIPIKRELMPYWMDVAGMGVQSVAYANVSKSPAGAIQVSAPPSPAAYVARATSVTLGPVAAVHIDKLIYLEVGK